MSTRKSTFAPILALGCAGFFCLGGSYTWTQDAGCCDFFWDDPDNWTGGSSFGEEFPDDGNDDALIPFVSSGNWLVRLIYIPPPAGTDYVIDDLTIEGSVNILATVNETPTLTADTVTIKGGATTETVVKIINDGAQIEAASCS